MSTSRLVEPLVVFPANGLPRLVQPRRTVAARAEKQGSKNVGFRFDSTFNRWVRDDRLAGNFKSDVQTLTGEVYTVWPVVYTALVEDYKLQSIPCTKASELQRRGYIIVDVRVPNEFQKGHSKGAVNVPLFQNVKGESFFDGVKKLASAFLNVPATERNPRFIEEAISAIPRKSKIVVMCNYGGTLERMVQVGMKVSNDPDRQFGRESRSLKACYELFEAGFKNIYHLEGGYQQWIYEGLENE